jgi:hypothetical protein
VQSYKRELDANEQGLRLLQEELRRRGIDLTECRLLDLFLWAYSGTYTPLYQRAEPGLGVAALHVPHLSDRRVFDGAQEQPGIDVEIFRDDDEGYLGWLASHPTGFVLTVARSPRPNYLILHKAACRTINGRPTRGGPWTGPYIKVCSGDALKLAAWTGREVGVAPRLCTVCRS